MKLVIYKPSHEKCVDYIPKHYKVCKKRNLELIKYAWGISLVRIEKDTKGAILAECPIAGVPWSDLQYSFFNWKKLYRVLVHNRVYK